MKLKGLWFGVANIKALSIHLLASSNSNNLNNPSQAKDYSPCVVVFGQPGAGKTTVAEAAVEAFGKDKDEGDDVVCLGLDLDVCVPQWMRDNFSKGMYPTLPQRQAFATDCCDYIEQQLEESWKDGGVSVASIVSFSFVNTDLRDVFRARFPSARWVLIDVTEEEASSRINQRQDHFYRGDVRDGSIEDHVIETTSNEIKEEEKDAVDNSEWKFASVTFEHTILDGTKPVEENAKKVLEALRETAKLL